MRRRAHERRELKRDVLLIGSGAGAAPLAFKLSCAGLDVLVLEKGPRHARSDYEHDEVWMQRNSAFFVPDVADDPHVLINHGASSTKPELTTLGWTASCVGGGTTHMGGAFYRFHPDDFHLRSRLGAFETIEDWPYQYGDLERYYGEAEWAVGVAGAAGANPFEGFRSREYPMPPMNTHPLAQALDDAGQRLGMHPFPTPRAMNSRPYDGRPACSYCSVCAGFGCPTGARGSAPETLLRKAESTGRCEIRPRAMVREITVGANGHATGCIYLDAAGQERTVEARLVCVCCSAVESARLLLLSRSSPFPDGLANHNGLVGRHLQFHGGSAGQARFRSREGQGAPPPAFLTRSIMDHYFLPSGVSSFPKGGLLKFEFARTPPIAKAIALAWEGTDSPMWGERLAARLRERFREYHDVAVEVFQDFVPNERTLVQLDPDVKDKWGLPVARMHLASPDHHGVAGKWLLSNGLEVLREAGAVAISEGAVGYPNSAMAHGTCRSGANPELSVLDSFCRAHSVPNLFVVDGSFMPTSGGVPTTLTIMANSFRTADYIIENAHTGEWR